uniref:Uncharacterized protein n=1 Tax=viral metagenome TaxID=1070528 RepID=A0A6C0CA30_9ZZZZ
MESLENGAEGNPAKIINAIPANVGYLSFVGFDQPINAIPADIRYVPFVDTLAKRMEDIND